MSDCSFWRQMTTGRGLRWAWYLFLIQDQLHFRGKDSRKPVWCWYWICACWSGSWRLSSRRHLPCLAQWRAAWGRDEREGGRRSQLVCGKVQRESRMWSLDAQQTKWVVCPQKDWPDQDAGKEELYVWPQKLLIQELRNCKTKKSCIPQQYYNNVKQKLIAFIFLFNTVILDWM